jgi:hypothetical protein
MDAFLINWVKKSEKRQANTELETDNSCSSSKKPRIKEEVVSKIVLETPVLNDINCEDADFDLPVCWNKTQANNFQSANDWLIIKNKSLGCRVCKEIKTLGAYADKNLRLSTVWQDCLVQPNCTTKESQQSSLRKKIFEHKKSEAHNKALEISTQLKKKEIDCQVENMHEKHFSTTEKVFRTVYKIVKNQRPFVDLPHEVDLQVLNGISLGKILHSDKTCAAIASHIATEMKKNICKDIISTKKKISVLIDESTTLSKRTVLIVVLRVFFEDIPGDPYTFNLDLIELSDASAESITKELLRCLNEHGFDEFFLKHCFIAFASDGASVMLGKNSGVATRLKTMFPNLVVWHCSNHRLELAVNDVVDEVYGINHFKIFMDKLYTLYHQSPKNQNELREAANSLVPKF